MSDEVRAVICTKVTAIAKDLSMPRGTINTVKPLNSGHLRA